MVPPEQKDSGRGEEACASGADTRDHIGHPDPRPQSFRHRSKVSDDTTANPHMGESNKLQWMFGVGVGAPRTVPGYVPVFLLGGTKGVPRKGV